MPNGCDALHRLVIESGQLDRNTCKNDLPVSAQFDNCCSEKAGQCRIENKTLLTVSFEPDSWDNSLLKFQLINFSEDTGGSSQV
jgi:hypothetical protein